MFNLDPNFGVPTMSFSTNIMAAATNYFLPEDYDLELVKEFVEKGSKHIQAITAAPGTSPEKINEMIAVVQGANRALMIRTILRNALIDVDASAQTKVSPVPGQVPDPSPIQPSVN
jgi:hypothetical protein